MIPHNDAGIRGEKLFKLMAPTCTLLDPRLPRLLRHISLARAPHVRPPPLRGVIVSLRWAIHQNRHLEQKIGRGGDHNVYMADQRRIHYPT